jgi:hypothetical protein
VDKRREFTKPEQQWITETKRGLAQRRGKKPDTKSGQIRALWPEIRAAIAEGQSLKSIRQWLEEEGGVVVTVQSLGSYLTRIRRKEQLRPVPQTAPTSPAEPTEFKGVSRAQKKKPRFESPPGPLDESKLI